MIAKLLAAAFTALVVTLPAQAQTYPSGPVRLIVAYSPGGTGDVVARIIADKLSIALGQSVVVENRAGGSGAIGAQAVARAAPDGLMLFLGQTGEMSINQHWLKGLAYDPDKDFEPIALGAIVPLGLVVPAKASYASMKEFYAALSTKKITFASAGAGTPGFFAGELLKLKSKGDLTHVPYKGAGPALNDVIGEHVDFYFPGLPAAMPHVKSGTLKLLAVSSAKRSSAAPDVPTVAEATGIENFDFTLWQGFFAPRGTPKPIIERLNKEINAVLDQADVRARLSAAGAEIVHMSSAEFAGFVQNESAKYLKIIKDTGVTAD
ncbi:MAG TPA: tripartite tricarboxylate transporter substrate binding protein [Pseudolabrys sp.]|nr:tripartite tricarboxylate transporter substrate binding protein [Pseudolabrys sp.]